MAEKKDIGWMYEGVKADVNREDYLLGKRIDKNFEKYSDAVVDQKPNAFESLMNRRSNQTAHTSTESKITNLNASVIKTEDPLVAVRLQQELRRKEAMENPLVRLKIQKMLLSMATEGKNKKDKKKKKKKKNKKNEHSSDSDSDSEPSSSKIKKRKREKEQRRSLKERSPSKKDRRDCRSPERSKTKKESHSSSDDENDIEKHPDFDKEEYERKKKLAGYGLVIVKKKDENETAASAPKNPYQSISVLPAPVTNKVPVKRKPMTQEEKEARLHEMQENAKWRETERLKNVKATKAIEKLEEEEEKQSTVPTFLRAQIVAASEQSLENRIQSNKRSVQRSYGYMEKKFSSR